MRWDRGEEGRCKSGRILDPFNLPVSATAVIPIEILKIRMPFFSYPWKHNETHDTCQFNVQEEVVPRFKQAINDALISEAGNAGKEVDKEREYQCL